MRRLPIVRVLEALEPIPLDALHEIRVELLTVDGICRIRAREWERVPVDSDQAKVQEWQASDEVIEVANPTIDGWLGVVYAAEQFRLEGYSAKR